MGSWVAAVLLMAVLRLGPDSCSTYDEIESWSDNCSGSAVPRFDAYSCVQKVTIALVVKLSDVLVMAVTRKLPCGYVLMVEAVLVLAVLKPSLRS